MSKETLAPIDYDQAAVYEAGDFSRLTRISAKAGAFACSFALAVGTLANFAPNIARAASTHPEVGIFDDEFKQLTIRASQAKIQKAKDIGVTIFKVSMPVYSSLKSPQDLHRPDALPLQNFMEAARLEDVNVDLLAMLPVWDEHSLAASGPNQLRNWCNTVAEEVDEYQDVITDVEILNEPNLRQFWRAPLFRADGTDAVTNKLMAITGVCYDAIKKVAPDVRVWAGNLASRGKDTSKLRPQSISPVTMIKNMCANARQDKRIRPYFDGFAIHSYPASDESQLTPHPNSTTRTVADINAVRQDLLCFDGTSQPSDVPVRVSELGVNTSYTLSPKNNRMAQGVNKQSEERQAEELVSGIREAYCSDSDVILFQFKDDDDNDPEAAHGGLFRFDGSPKPSLDAVTHMLSEINSGSTTNIHEGP